jgi:hypothetical protein
MERTCPRCRRVCFSEAEFANHSCRDLKAELEAEIAYAAEHRRSGTSIPLDSTCMVCGNYKPCVRVIDIGWICLDCQAGR